MRPIVSPWNWTRLVILDSHSAQKYGGVLVDISIELFKLYVTDVLESRENCLKKSDHVVYFTKRQIQLDCRLEELISYRNSCHLDFFGPGSLVYDKYRREIGMITFRGKFAFGITYLSDLAKSSGFKLPPFMEPLPPSKKKEMSGSY
jgi:hypothetical protein